MFCRKCGNKIEENEKFCSKCGTPCIQNMQTGGQVNKVPEKSVIKKKSLLTQWWFWFIVVGVVVVGIIIGLSVEEDNGYNDVSSYTKAEIYEALGENDACPYTMSSKAYDFILNNEELFPTYIKSEAEDITDYYADYRMVTKNPGKYSDKLINVSDAYVLKISETSEEDEVTFTAMQIVSDDGEDFYILYLGTLGGIYEGDYVDVFGLPLANVSFDNQGGGVTNAIMLAGSYVEKIYY